MAADHNQYNFSSVIDEFFTLKPLTGPHASALRQLVEKRAREILAHPDVRYMPAFKILDLFTDMVNTAGAIDEEKQLREEEALALLRNVLSADAMRLRQFMLDAALERARYEPMMIAGAAENEGKLRDLTLRKRWQSMRATHQSMSALPQPWMDAVEAAVESVIAASCFDGYRQGPLLQCFAEMLATARQLHTSGRPLESLAEALGEDSPLWKRYALKALRYRAKTPPAAFFFPNNPASSTVH